MSFYTSSTMKNVIHRKCLKRLNNISFGVFQLVMRRDEGVGEWDENLEKEEYLGVLENES